jgi:probable HAF family extracellular repeat protein
MHSLRKSRSVIAFRPRLEVLEDRCLLSTYSITDLGTNFTPVALNNNGAVVGYMDNSGQLVPTLFENGTFITLTGLTSVAGLNDSNVVSGSEGTQAVLWNNGVITPVALEGALADNGTIAGGADVDVNGTVTPLSPSPSDFAPLRISSNGQYVGGSAFGTGEAAAIIWNVATGKGTFVEPAIPGQTLGQTNGVNNSGEAVGQIEEDEGGSAFLYSNGQLTDLGLGSAGLGIGSSANAINDEGVIVGVGAGGFNPFVDSNGVFTNLQSVLTGNSGFTLTNATAINDNGQILATATDASGTNHFLLLNPTATPTLSLSGFPSTTTAGVAQNLTVTVLNPNGTVDTGYTGTIHFSSTDQQAGLPANFTFTTADAGVATFSVTLKTAGTQSITAQDTSNPGIIGSETGITVTAAAPTHFTLSVFQTAMTRGGEDFYILVEPTDAFGNVTSFSTNTTVKFSDSARGATLPANYTFTPGTEGAEFEVKLKTGEQTITVTDLNDPAIDGSITLDAI